MGKDGLKTLRYLLMKNNLNLQEALEEITTGIKNMTVEDYETKVLCLNGNMTTELFDKVIEEVTSKIRLDDEDLWYHKKDYLITQEEFLDVFHYIDKVIETKADLEDETFISVTGYFKYKNNCFEWNVISGQGSICSIRYIDYNEDLLEVKIDPEIKFYKRLASE